MSAAISHASPERALPTTDLTTGEVRVPLRLLSIDRLLAVAPLVLSRREAELLRDRLAELLLPTPHSVRTQP